MGARRLMSSKPATSEQGKVDSVLQKVFELFPEDDDSSITILGNMALDDCLQSLACLLAPAIAKANERVAICVANRLMGSSILQFASRH